MTSGEFDNNLDNRLVAIEMALRPNGVLGQIAAEVTEREDTLTPQDAGDIILPPKNPGEEYKTRMQLVENAPDKVKAAISEHADGIFSLADQVGMRKAESITDEELERIAPGAAIWVIEGGANKTSVVRRAVATEALSRLLPEGERIEDQFIFQLGSSERILEKVRADGSEHPEHKVAREICGEYYPDEDYTEFELNVASALAQGYEIISDVVEEMPEGVGNFVYMGKQGAPTLIHISPVIGSEENGLRAGLSSIARFNSIPEGSQFVIATNGQYRPKDEQIAKQWAIVNSAEMLDPVALGDEQGFTVEHLGRPIETAKRSPIAYVNEMIILERGKVAGLEEQKNIELQVAQDERYASGDAINEMFAAAQFEDAEAAQASADARYEKRVAEIEAKYSR